MIVAAEFDGSFGNSGGKGVFITRVVVGLIENRPYHVWRRNVAETIIALAKGNITIVIVVAFAMFRTRFQENRIHFGAELK